MVGDETAKYLHGLFSESFKREIDADEAVWRSLPFFGALIALAIAVLPAIYASTAMIGHRGWHACALTFLTLSLLSFGFAGYWFYIVIRRRQYRYPPSDETLLEFAERLVDFYASEPEPVARDTLVRDDLRANMLSSFAQATTNNARNNHRKAAARSQVLLFAMAGFLLAFVAEGIILVSRLVSWCPI